MICCRRVTPARYVLRVLTGEEYPELVTIVIGLLIALGCIGLFAGAIWIMMRVVIAMKNDTRFVLFNNPGVWARRLRKKL
jgi:uncharacterized membrane protein